MESCCNSICDYGGEITGFSDYECKKKLFLKAARAFLGVPKSSPRTTVIAEITWLEPIYRTRIKMVRQYNRVLSMPENRLTRRVINWDICLSKHVTFETWSKEVKQILSEADLSYLYHNYCSFSLKPVIDIIKNQMLLKQQENLHISSQSYSKLKNYITFKDFSCEPSYLSLSLSFPERKNFCKALMGILTIKEELLFSSSCPSGREIL